MKMITLNNGVDIPSIGYGSAIVLKYMWGNYSKKSIAKYWIKNLLKNKKQFKQDKALKNILNADIAEPMLIDTSRAYAGSEYVIGKSIKIIVINILLLLSYVIRINTVIM